MFMPIILLMRPANRIAADLEVCRQCGWQGVAFSSLKIIPLIEKKVGLYHQFTSANVLFWVSPTAVEIALQLLEDFPKNKNIIHIAVGEATAKALKYAGVEHVHYSQQGNDSEAAANLPIWKQLPIGAQVLIVRGEGGRDTLAQILCKRGLLVTFAEIYRREMCMPDWSLLNNEQVQYAWLTSTQAMQSLFKQVSKENREKLLNLRYFTHHTRIAESILAQGGHDVWVVKNLQTALNNAHLYLA